MNKQIETLPLYRHECLHTVHIIQEMFYNNVTESVYATSGINPKLENALLEAERALGKVYQIIDEDSEGCVDD